MRGLKGIDRFRGVIEEGHYSVKNQGMSALNHIHFWGRIQMEIRARWLGMVVESRARQKKLDNQFKLDSKLHELEVNLQSKQEYCFFFFTLHPFLALQSFAIIEGTTGILWLN